jgi:hypothetical protein
MRHLVFGLLALGGMVPTASAHFIFLTPYSDGSGYGIVYSDTPAPDVKVRSDAMDRFEVRGWGGEVTGKAITHQPPKDGVARAETSLPVAAGSVVYGVIRRGDESPILLTYHAKSIRVGERYEKPVGLPLELTPIQKNGGLAFLVTENGQPIMSQEVVLNIPGETNPVAVRTGNDGLTPSFNTPGGYTARTYRTVNTPGEYSGRRYQATRHYSTLTATIRP